MQKLVQQTNGTVAPVANPSRRNARYLHNRFWRQPPVHIKQSSIAELIWAAFDPTPHETEPSRDPALSRHNASSICRLTPRQAYHEALDALRPKRSLGRREPFPGANVAGRNPDQLLDAAFAELQRLEAIFGPSSPAAERVLWALERRLPRPASRFR